MGTFMGHVLPGAFFIFFGIWHIVNIYIRYFKCKLAGRRFFTSATFPCYTANYPIEGILKIVATTIGSIGEIKTGYVSSRGTVIPGNSQHVTMFSAFGLSGLVDILAFYRVLWLPPKTEFAMSALAFICEGLLFAFHQHSAGHDGQGGHQIMEMTVHSLLLYVIIVSVVVVLAEIACSHHFLLTLMRGILLLIQGTWFIQVGFILYPPWVPGQESRWDMTSHDSSMYAVMIFCFNIFSCLAITAIIGSLVRNGIAPGQLLVHAMERKTGTSNGHAGAAATPGLMNADSDSESECELFVPTRVAHPP